MVGLFPRYQPLEFRSYFAKDFGAKIWQAGTPLGEFCEPRRARLWAEEGPPAVWECLSEERFGRLMDGLERLVGREKGWSKSRLVALEPIFSPPKSVSVSALAGPEISLELLTLHSCAVGQALDWGRQFLGTRRKDPTDFCVEALRFPHPFSALKDPQVHEHAALIWLLEDREKQGALHGYPLFFHLQALQSYYHYCLAALLRAAGYRIERSPERPAAWELAGIDRGVIGVFSQRSEGILTWSDSWSDYESAGAARRFAALGSRRILPETPEVSLEEARLRWAKQVEPSRCSPQRTERVREDLLRIGGMTRHFESSAVTTMAMLKGRVLGACLGQGVPVEQACAQIDDAISNAISHGEIVAKGPSAVCHPEVFRMEREILETLRAGLGRGSNCRLVVPSGDSKAPKVSRSLASAAHRRDRVRIVSAKGKALDGEAVLELKNGSRGREAPWLILLRRWNAAEVRRFLSEDRKETGGKRDIMVVVEEADHAGDFVRLASQIASVAEAGSLGRARQLRFDGKVIEIQPDGLPRYGSRRFPPLEGRSASELRVVVAGADYPDSLRRWRNIQLGREWVLAQPEESKGPLITLDIPLPWPAPGAEYDWGGKGFFAFRYGGPFRHSSRWMVEGVTEDPTVLKIRARKRPGLIRVSDFKEPESTTALIKPMQFRFAPGLQLEVLLDYAMDGLKLFRGEIVLVAKILEEAIELSDGRIVPDRFRAFSPGGIVTELVPEQRPPEVLFVANPLTEDFLSRWKRYAAARRVVVPAPDAGKMKVALAGKIHTHLKKIRWETNERQLHGEEASRYGVLPPRGAWQIKDAEPEKEPALEQPASVEEERTPDIESAETIPPEAPAETPPVPSAHSSVATKGEERLKQEISEAREAPRPSAVENVPEVLEPDDAVKVVPSGAAGKEARATTKEILQADAVAETPPVPPPRARPSSAENEEGDEAARKRRKKKALEETAGPPKVPVVQAKPTKRVKPVGKGEGKGKGTKKQGGFSEGEVGGL